MVPTYDTVVRFHRKFVSAIDNMKKGQAVKFWKGLSNSTNAKEVISAFANKRGYGGKRTLVRYSQAAAGFKEGLLCNVIAGNTGWSADYIDKIHAWWEEAFPSEVGPVTQELATRVAPARTEDEVPKEARTEQESYKETSHKRKMRKLAKELAERINLPSLWDKDLWRDLPVDFQPGKYSLPIGAVKIGKDKQIHVNYYDVSANFAAPHLVKGLYGHLSTSGLSKFTGLVSDKGKLKVWEGEVGQYSRELLMFLKLIVDEVKGYRAKVSFHDEAKPGLTKWFIAIAWNDALQKATGYSWIDDSWYKPPENIPNTSLWKLNCGAYAIGIARSKRTLKTYEKWHKKLRVKYAENPIAKDIGAKQQELRNIAEEIRQRLQEFSDMERLPGHCELC